MFPNEQQGGSSGSSSTVRTTPAFPYSSGSSWSDRNGFSNFQKPMDEDSVSHNSTSSSSCPSDLATQNPFQSHSALRSSFRRVVFGENRQEVACGHRQDRQVVLCEQSVHADAETSANMVADIRGDEDSDRTVRKSRKLMRKISNSDSPLGVMAPIIKLRSDEFHRQESRALRPTQTRWYHEVFAGFMSGCLQVIIFNPYDRALYLATINNRKFIDRRNWGGGSDLNRGLLPNLMQRSISYGVYFPMEQIYLRMLISRDNALISNTIAVAPIAGQLTGATSALLTNNLSMLKYQQYMKTTNEGMVKDASNMLAKGGFLSKGLFATILRDSLFGCTFTTFRVMFQDEEQQFLVNFVAASLASVLAGPFNYCRNVQYAHGGAVADKSYPTIWKVMGGFLLDLRAFNFRNLYMKLRPGWGSIRVGVGMAVGNKLYRFFDSQISGLRMEEL